MSSKSEASVACSCLSGITKSRLDYSPAACWMFLGWMMSCAASPLILMPNHYWPLSILLTLEILNGIALDAEQIHRCIHPDRPV
ncbi:MAG: hypothetical protein KKG97_11275 [Proteobacteria bacterium]|nr:hypothetical protein [Pseudomonadota bacterium]